MKDYCDKKCSECDITHSENIKQIYSLLYYLHIEKNNNLANKICSHISVCPECKVGDFAHHRDCYFMVELQGK